MNSSPDSLHTAPLVIGPGSDAAATEQA